MLDRSEFFGPPSRSPPKTFTESDGVQRQLRGESAQGGYVGFACARCHGLAKACGECGIPAAVCLCGAGWPACRPGSSRASLDVGVDLGLIEQHCAPVIADRIGEPRRSGELRAVVAPVDVDGIQRDAHLLGDVVAADPPGGSTVLLTHRHTALPSPIDSPVVWLVGGAIAAPFMNVTTRRRRLSAESLRRHAWTVT